MQPVKSIRLVTNVSFAGKGEVSGLQRYQLELYKNLQAQLPQNIPLKTTVLRPCEVTGISQFDSLLSGFVKYPLKVRRDLEESEILHVFTHHFAYLLLGIRHDQTMVTCFDMIPFARSWEQSWKEKGLMALVLKGMKKAKKIIAISNWTKKEIIKFAGIPENRITVVPCGVDNSRYFPDIESGKNFRAKMGIPESRPIFLYVGSEQPRKNLGTLVFALGLLAKGGRDFLFMKVGQPQWVDGRKSFLKQIRDANLEKRTRIVEYAPEDPGVDDFSLREIYNAADIFLFPSLYEGFGLPLLEAMACGVPIIASNVTSIPEVVGDGAALLVPPTDPEAWSETISLLVDSRGKRSELRNKGFVNIKKFDWNRSAEILKNVYLS